MNNTIELRAKQCSLRLIQNDCETVKSIVLKHQNSIFGMCFVPYMALFCRSAQEYFGISLVDPKIDAEIYDLRNSIKYYGERYGKSKKRVLDSDEWQNTEFREMLRFNFTKGMNIHYNLGIYFDDKRHVVGNTQLIADYLNLNSLSDKEKEEKVYILAYNLGSIIGRMSGAFLKQEAICSVQTGGNLPVFHYCDQNTNVSRVFNSQNAKDINLFLLHILSNLGFVKYVLETIILYTNPWMTRIKYTITYYSYCGLKKLKAHIENNNSDKYRDLLREIDAIILSGEGLFTSRFRNCMMHYNLSNNGKFEISDDCFDERKPLFGLIEECFDGEPYDRYYSDISSLSDRIEQFIESQFNFHKAHIQKL